MPGLHQPVPGAFGGDGLAVQLPRQADGELADVDHLLHLAEGLGGDLACLDRDECGQIGLVLDEQLAQAGHQGSADGCRGGAPRRKRLRCFGYRSVCLFGSGLGDGEQHVAGDGRAGLQAGDAPLALAGRAEFGARADGVQCVTHLAAQAIGGRKRRCGNGGHDDATFS